MPSKIARRIKTLHRQNATYTTTIGYDAFDKPIEGRVSDTPLREWAREYEPELYNEWMGNKRGEN